MSDADGKYVVVQNGQKVTPPTPSQTEAQQEADRRNKLLEQGQQPSGQGKAEVKQVLNG